MIYGMAKELILLASHLRLSLRVSGKKEYLMDRLRQCIETEINLLESLEMAKNMEKALCIMGMARNFKASLQMIGQMEEEK